MSKVILNFITFFKTSIFLHEITCVMQTPQLNQSIKLFLVFIQCINNSWYFYNDTNKANLNLTKILQSYLNMHIEVGERARNFSSKPYDQNLTIIWYILFEEYLDYEICFDTSHMTIIPYPILISYLYAGTSM